MEDVITIGRFELCAGGGGEWGFPSPPLNGVVLTSFDVFLCKNPPHLFSRDFFTDPSSSSFSSECQPHVRDVELASHVLGSQLCGSWCAHMYENPENLSLRCFGVGMLSGDGGGLFNLPRLRCMA